MILVGVGNGIGAGANSLISRFIGAKDKRSRQCNSTFINIKYNYFNRFYGAFHCNIRPYIKIMGASEVLNYCKEYGVVLFIWTFSLVIPTIIGGIF